jgi:hypothetical protein
LHRENLEIRFRRSSPFDFRASRLPSAVAPHELVREVKGYTAIAKEVSNDSRQLRTVSSEVQFQVAEFPLFDVGITLDSTNVIGFALRFIPLTLAHKIISQNSIELFLVRVEIRNRPLLFDVR